MVVVLHVWVEVRVTAALVGHLLVSPLQGNVKQAVRVMSMRTGVEDAIVRDGGLSLSSDIRR